MEATYENELQLDRDFCAASLLNFTRYFFYQQHGRKFIIGDHHKQICEKLDDVIAGKITRLIINIAPRYGKTELAVKSFIAYGLAVNPSSRFIHLSYSDDLALDNSESVKDIVALPKYSDLFPDIEIKKGSDSKKKWYTTVGGGVYATAAGGQVTGFGAGRVDLDSDDLDEMMPYGNVSFSGALIIDDPIKPDDADSDTVRERVNSRFDSTIINRVNSRNTPIIIIMQRLHERDLCGYVMENYPEEWEVLSLPCIITEENQSLQDGRALWEFKHTINELLKMNSINPINFGRQYMQNPQPKEGLLYKPFKTYSVIPPSDTYEIKSYTDTADTGKDFLCSIAYLETEDAMYVKDVIYTQDAMETTEPLVARQIVVNKVKHSKIESNNGGRGFARNVEKHVITMGVTDIDIEWFHQSSNKDARIFTNSASVNTLIIMPAGWEHKWPVFHKHVTSYMAKGGNAFDDAADVLTGMAENFSNKEEFWVL